MSKSISIVARVLVLLIGTVHVAYGEYDVNAYCTIVKNGVKLPSIESCQKFYVCNNGIGTEDYCSSTQAFDKESQSCKLSSEVDCYYGVANPCEGKDKTYAPITGTCNGWIYCVNGTELGRGYCGSGLIFSNNQCIYGECNSSGNENESELTSVCQLMQQNVYFGSTMNCKTWQICKADGIMSNDCPDPYVFDVQNRLCDYESGTMCSRVTGEEIQPEENPVQTCTVADEGTSKPDPNNCTIHYECISEKYQIYYCPNGQYYDEPTQTCKLRQEATPVATCDRCFGSKKQFVNYVDADCQKYWICKNDVQIGNSECDTGLYFDEIAQACIYEDDSNKTEYIESNGACQADGGSTGSDCSAECADAQPPECTPASGDCKCISNTEDPPTCIVDPNAF